jgi:hypothetical protein
MYSGSIYDLDNLRKTFNSITLCRVPRTNTLGELKELRKAWDAVDKNHQRADESMWLTHVLFLWLTGCGVVFAVMNYIWEGGHSIV